MGIVVCIAMLLGVLSFLPTPWRVIQNNTDQPIAVIAKIKRMSPPLLLAMGIWNSAWYGLRHLGSFWGNIAVASGLIMILAALLLLETPDADDGRIIIKLRHHLEPIRLVIFIGLLASFLLYFITLVQLNLGMPIVS